MDDRTLDKDFDFIQSKTWSQKELLAEEFKSLGFYISDHPLNEYKEIFSQLNISLYNDFVNSHNNEALVVGTIMSIQEKKSIKGTPFAIIKFSDNQGEFELFLFSEILIKNREKLKESESFVMTLQKDKTSNLTTQRRISVKKILSLDEMIKKPYKQVTIELKDNCKLEELKKMLDIKGETDIKLIFNENNKKIYYNLKNPRKFDFNQLKMIKNKEYIKKIIV